MRIVALDPSLTATGVADSADPEHPFVLSPPSGARGPERLFWIQKQVDRVTRGADLVAVEGYAHGAKYQAHQMGELGGVIRLTLWCRNTPYVDVPPPVRMKVATGKGQAKKEHVLAEAIQRLGYAGHDNNEADALWILQAALQHYQLPGAVPLPAKHLEPLAKSRPNWPTLEQLAGKGAA